VSAGLLVAITDPGGQAEGVEMRGAGLCRVARREQRLAVGVEPPGLAGAVACLPEGRDSRLLPPRRLPVASLPPLDDAEVAERASLAEPVSGRPGDRDRLPEVPGCLLVPVSQACHGTQPAQDVGLAMPVTQLAVDRERGQLTLGCPVIVRLLAQDPGKVVQ
jgi:hypothetical protein